MAYHSPLTHNLKMERKLHDFPNITMPVRDKAEIWLHLNPVSLTSNPLISTLYSTISYKKNSLYKTKVTCLHKFNSLSQLFTVVSRDINYIVR